MAAEGARRPIEVLGIWYWVLGKETPSGDANLKLARSGSLLVIGSV